MVALTKRNEKERRLAIKTASAYFADAKLGDSIMVDGVCLTITTYNDHEATFDVMVPNNGLSPGCKTIRLVKSVNLGASHTGR
ncbi:hypothetical protein [Weissella cibaria]|uniref:hypothetical protein n=1 Tax=Weissella cibaria TaxID=137591 RepID=UPI001F38F9BC|nr:hypothetical protein [Weissella cibaria]